MSTIKSSDEHLTLNADGSSKDIKLQSNASEKVIIKSDGKVGIGTNTPARTLHISDTTSGATTGIRLTGANNGSQVIEFADTDDDNVGYIQYDHGNNRISIRAGDANRLNIDSDGLKFGTDTASANALDDYEEGTCTMNFKASGSSTLAGTSSTTYTKIGKMVTVQGEISGTISSLTQNANMNLEGLPFTPNATGSCAIFTRYLEAPSDTTNVVGYYNSGGPTIEIWFMPNHANYVRAKVEDFHNSSNDIYFTITYFTNS